MFYANPAGQTAGIYTGTKYTPLPWPANVVDAAWLASADYTLRREGASVLVIVIYQQEVSPMNAVSAVGAPLQSTIARLR